MQTKHTPGPWIVEPQYTNRNCFPISHDLGNGARGILAEVNSQGGMELEQSANARLIAAAPELLTALKELTEIARTFRNVPKSEQNWGQLDDDVLEQAFEAIAKAERGAR